MMADKTPFKKDDTVYHFSGKTLIVKHVYEGQVSGPGFSLPYKELSFKPYDLVKGGLTHERPVIQLYRIVKIDFTSKKDIVLVLEEENNVPVNRFINYCYTSPLGELDIWQLIQIWRNGTLTNVDLLNSIENK